jgi:release factor glutamine methyltransferase
MLAQGAARLAKAGVAQAALDARLLLQAASGRDHAGLIAAGNEPAGDEVGRRYGPLLARRAAREPVSRILGAREFFGLEFAITSDVLDPRPETELLVETILERLARHDAPLRFADLGTGSGAIAVALLTRLPAANCVATDLSAAALAVARANASRHGVAARLEARLADLLAGIGGPFDFVVSNPPYIRTADIAGLDPEVARFDPALALDGGKDGLDLYRRLFSQLGAHRGSIPLAFLEIGAGQAPDVGEIAHAHGWRATETRRDISGIERVVMAMPGAT